MSNVADETSNPVKGSWLKDLSILLAIFVLLGLSAVWVLEYQTQRARAKGSGVISCMNNGKNLGLVMQNYASQNAGQLAPAVLAGPDGEALHSWRTTMLPHLDNADLHRLIDLDQAWDAEPNYLYRSVEIPYFLCPASDDASGNRTNWFVITGEETIFPGTESRTFDELKQADGSTDTLMFIEGTGMNVPWMQPRDIPYSALTKSPAELRGVGPSSDHYNGTVNAIFADGHFKTLNEKIDPAVLRALAGWNDGIAIDHESF